MRVLEVESFGRGGLLHYAFNLSRALAERGHEVTLVTAAGHELEGHRALPPGARLVEATARWTRGPLAAWPGWALRAARKVEAVVDAFAVAAVARRLRPDVVHLHSTNPIALLELTLLRLSRQRVVATAHVVTPHEPMRFEKAIYGRSYRLAERVIAHAEVDRRRLAAELGVDPGRVDVIPHGEYGFFAAGDGPPDRQAARAGLGLEPADEVTLFFGFIREYKGLDVLLDAWPRVVAARPAARLLIAGDASRLAPARRRELERRAARLGAVHRFGYVPFAEVPSYLAAADVLALPYRRASQSGVLYAALAAGLPVVASRVGALPEVVSDGDSGLLVAPESPAELAAALVRLLADGGLRERLARGGRRLARRHSWPAIAERTETAFAAVR